MKRYFDRIYIINLPHRMDRRKEMEEQLSKVNLAIDDVHLRFFPAIRPMDPAGFPSLGARGCFMSHLAVLIHARDLGAKNVLIIEDDCNFAKDFEIRLAEIHSALQSGAWDLFYGGALNEVDAKKLKNSWLDSTQGLMGSHFIAVNGPCIARLIDYLEAMLKRPDGHPDGGPMHIDGAYSWFRAAHPELKTYLATPELAYQRSSATDIHQRSWYENFPIVGWVLSQVRRAKNKILIFFK